jgi:hypothetical protein
MRNLKIVIIISCAIILLIGIFGVFIYWVFPKIESPAFAGFIGVLVGTFAGIFGSLLTAILGLWQTAKDSDEKLKDRISNHALQLTQMDYDLRQKSLELSGQVQKFLAPAKVYRTFYRALYELHTAGDWPKDAESLGLLNVFTLGKNLAEQPPAQGPQKAGDRG